MCLLFPANKTGVYTALSCSIFGQPRQLLIVSSRVHAAGGCDTYLRSSFMESIAKVVVVAAAVVIVVVVVVAVIKAVAVCCCCHCFCCR